MTATLLSTVTGGGIGGETVNFTLNGTSVGNGITSSTGVATLTGVTTTAAVGSHAGAVQATFSGDSNYGPAPSGQGALVVSKAGTSLGNVSGTSPIGGPATLTATLASTVTSQPIGGETVDFTLNGTPVGTAVTNGSGIATLTGVATSDGAGTHVGAIVASFAGDASYLAAPNGTGNLVVGQSATTLGTVLGTASFGGTATLKATLTSSVTSLGIPGQTVSFMLDHTQVGTAVTDSNGIATLTGVATTAGVGTDTGGVVASFSGSANFLAAPNGTGNLVVSKAATALGTVTGTAAFGGTATLSAILTSTVTGQVIPGETVNFSLDGTPVGSAVTNNSGIAILSGVATADTVGTYTGAVVVSFAGDSNYSAAPNASGDLVVSKAGTALASVSGTSSFGGTASLLATLTSSVTGLGIAGETVSFTLDNTVVGTAVTNASGIATLTGVATADAAGTHTGAVVASFVGDANYSAAANGTGDLVVSKAGTTLGTVSGTASFGGTATLTAKLSSSVTGLGVAGETVSFTLDNTVVGTAVTNASGVATLTGVATSDAAGTHADVVVASFVGDSNYSAAADATGNLDVSKAGTALGAVSGTALFGGGGNAFLTATLTSSVTGLGVAGETVTFTLDNTVVGTAVTNGSGVALLGGLNISDGVGTYTGAVVASFAGDTNYLAAADASGDLTVMAAPTRIQSVSGTSPIGGPATLMATLISTVTNMGIQGETVDFTLDGVPVGTAVTDANGLAILTGVPTSDPAGTDPGGVVANFGGDTNYNPSQGVGDLTVS